MRAFSVCFLLMVALLPWATPALAQDTPPDPASAEVSQDAPPADTPLAGEPSDPLGDAARAVLDRYRKAVVTLKIVVSVSFGNNESENETEANATMLTPDGLAVLALSAIDPTALLGAEITADPDNPFSLRVVSLKMILSSGEEREAEVVLRDKDLDVVFVRLKEVPAEPLPFADPAQAADSVRILDPYVCIGQEGPVVQRAHTAFIDRIEGVVERPRTYYLVSRTRIQQILCSPLFTPGGHLIGFGVARQNRNDDEDNDLLAVVIPAAQIRELMGQVPPRGETPAEPPQP